MKKLLSLCVLLLFIGCEKPGDCVKSSGQMTSKAYDGLSFSKILVNKGIGAVIKQGDTCKVEVKAGQNLINDIEVKVVDGMLTITDNTTCNWTREYGETVIYITAPNITDIFSKTEQNIISDGILGFPNLRIAAMDTYDGQPGVGTGNYIMTLETQNLNVQDNNVGAFYLTGHAQKMAINFYESGGILHGENLLANTIEIYHRGTNDMVVHPLDTMRGGIYNTGNVYSINHPPVVQVTEYYHGRLIFN